MLTPRVYCRLYRTFLRSTDMGNRVDFALCKDILPWSSPLHFQSPRDIREAVKFAVRNGGTVKGTFPDPFAVLRTIQQYKAFYAYDSAEPIRLPVISVEAPAFPHQRIALSPRYNLPPPPFVIAPLSARYVDDAIAEAYRPHGEESGDRLVNTTLEHAMSDARLEKSESATETTEDDVFDDDAVDPDASSTTVAPLSSHRPNGVLVLNVDACELAHDFGWLDLGPRVVVPLLTSSTLKDRMVAVSTSVAVVRDTDMSVRCRRPRSPPLAPPDAPLPTVADEPHTPPAADPQKDADTAAAEALTRALRARIHSRLRERYGELVSVSVSAAGGVAAHETTTGDSASPGTNGASPAALGGALADTTTNSAAATATSGGPGDDGIIRPTANTIAPTTEAASAVRETSAMLDVLATSDPPMFSSDPARAAQHRAAPDASSSARAPAPRFEDWADHIVASMQFSAAMPLDPTAFSFWLADRVLSAEFSRAGGRRSAQQQQQQQPAEGAESTENDAPPSSDAPASATDAVATSGRGGAVASAAANSEAADDGARGKGRRKKEPTSRKPKVSERRDDDASGSADALQAAVPPVAETDGRDADVELARTCSFDTFYQTIFTTRSTLRRLRLLETRMGANVTELGSVSDALLNRMSADTAAPVRRPDNRRKKTEVSLTCSPN